MADYDSDNPEEGICPNCLEHVKDAGEHVTRDAGSQWTPYYYDCKKPKKCSNCGSKKPANSMIAVPTTKTVCCNLACLSQLMYKITTYRKLKYPV